MDELIKKIEVFRKRLDSILQSLRVAEKEREIEQLNHRMMEQNFWSDAKNAQAVSRRHADLMRIVTLWRGIEKRASDLNAVATDDKDDHAISLLDELQRNLAELEESVSSKEIEIFLSDEYDGHPAIVTIYSGAGGVDAQDWAEMLERMYLRFADRCNFATAVLQRTPGQEAGIKNVTIRFEGAFAYGYLRNESGVHRLVRLSPFDADQQRHTSFAMVEVLPELEEPTTITVGPDDVRVDVFRASGHGGQSVNTTDSAVRLTHLPTGITVVCQNERSQLQNKAQAWKMLLGKLERYYQAQREEERQLLRGEFTEAAWGNQIRSYVIHPYKMVKDHRTKYEVKDPERILDGDLMAFIEAELRRQKIGA